MWEEGGRGVLVDDKGGRVLGGRRGGRRGWGRGRRVVGGEAGRQGRGIMGMQRRRGEGGGRQVGGGEMRGGGGKEGGGVIGR